MKIVQADIGMNSKRTFEKRATHKESLNVINGNTQISLQSESDSVELGSAQARSEFMMRQAGEDTDLLRPPGLERRGLGLRLPNAGQNNRFGMGNAQGSPMEAQLIDTISDEEKAEGNLSPQLKLTKKLMESIFKKDVTINSGEAFLKASMQSASSSSAQFVRADMQGLVMVGAQGQGEQFGVSYERETTHYESEQTKFYAAGKVQTEDGREIDFSLQLEMSREFASQEKVSFRAGALKDPLVLNFDGGAAELTDSKFTFDIDSDGEGDSVSFLRGGSAFLSFDKNGDGVINNGSELFGAQTGNGFQELAAYDEDGNGFIDEGDSVFSKLSLYNKDSAGNDMMTSLQDAGVGALYLDSVGTEFSVNKLETNEQQGQIRSSGVFINEDGTVGTMQQVDLVVENDEPVAAVQQEPIDQPQEPQEPTGGVDIVG